MTPLIPETYCFSYNNSYLWKCCKQSSVASAIILSNWWPFVSSNLETLFAKSFLVRIFWFFFDCAVHLKEDFGSGFFNLLPCIRKPQSSAICLLFRFQMELSTSYKYSLFLHCRQESSVLAALCQFVIFWLNSLESLHLKRHAAQTMHVIYTKIIYLKHFSFFFRCELCLNVSFRLSVIVSICLWSKNPYSYLWKYL